MRPWRTIHGDKFMEYIVFRFKTFRSTLCASMGENEILGSSCSTFSVSAKRTNIKNVEPNSTFRYSIYILMQCIGITSQLAVPGKYIMNVTHNSDYLRCTMWNMWVNECSRSGNNASWLVEAGLLAYWAKVGKLPNNENHSKIMLPKQFEREMEMLLHASSNGIVQWDDTIHGIIDIFGPHTWIALFRCPISKFNVMVVLVMAIGKMLCL